MRYVVTVAAAVLLLWTPLVRTGESVANCLACHAASSDQPVHAVFRTAHAGIGGGGSDSCVACHGGSTDHALGPIGVSPDVSFGPRWAGDSVDQTQACRTCHVGEQLTMWVGSVHDDEDVTCTDCHAIHTRHDAALDRVGQSARCFECHQEVRVSVRLASRHPIAEGRTACVDCHNPHGSTTQAALVQPTLNDTCYECHAEKRGPFLFEHPPATEDCSICHRPHGSVNDRLLKVRGPYLCQQCHSAAFHPSQLFDGDGLPTNMPNQNLLGRNCMNCHSQVHGTNHPSGARMAR